ncbi:hypothetical protein Tco_1214021 [Tanacetum coccineum]
MENENPIGTLGDYSRPSHEGYRNTIELPDGNNVVPLRSDIIWLVQNECSFHGLRSKDPNQHLKDFIKFVDSHDLDVNLALNHGLVSRTYSEKSLIMALIFGSKSKSFMTMSIPLQGKLSINRTVDFAKPVKAISLPQDALSISDRRLIELENQVQHLMEAHPAPKSFIQVNKITSSCEIYSGPMTLNTSWKIQSKLLLIMHHYVPTKREVSGSLSNPIKIILVTPIIRHGKFTQTLDARLSKFEADFKQQQGEMTNKINTFLKAINDRMTGGLPSDTIKNPKLNVNSISSVLSARSYPMEDP